MKVILTGGGTGGHLFPALAIAESLRKRDPRVELLFLGSQRGLEATAVPQADLPFEGLPAMPLPRRFSPRLFRAGIADFRAVLAARAALRRFRPDVIFATGGFASAPVLAAAWMEKTPVLLHEQNAVPGLTNRIASRFAREVHLTFSASRRYFPRRDNLRLSGMPLREGIVGGSRNKALRLFRLEEGRTTILVFGGSQGAHHINEAILDALPRFANQRGIQFILQAGQKDYAWMLERCRAIPVRTWVRPFIQNMGEAYAIADLVVCRAGALTLAELHATGKPAILVPYPYATADHQTQNAEGSVEAGAAVMIPDAQLDGPALASRILDLIEDRRELRRMSIQAMRLARPDAADRIVRAILRYPEAADGTEGEPEPHPRAASAERPVRRRRGGARRGGDVARQGA